MRSMSYRQLLEVLQTLSRDELDDPVTIYMESEDEAYGVTHTDTVKEGSPLDGVIDLDVPILVIGQ
jgi:hypothetical protein